MRSFTNNLPYDAVLEIEDASTKYEYPDGLDLRPGSELHDNVVKMVLDCARRGYDVNQNHIADDKRVDMCLDGYMPADEVDNARLLEDSRKPVNVVYPMLTAHRALFLTAMHRAYFSNGTVRRYKGEGTPERAAKAALANKMMERISGWFRHRRSCDLHWGDAFSYGRAYAWGKWSKRTAPRMATEVVDELLSSLTGGAFRPGDMVRYLDETNRELREGTDWIPLDNYQVFTDPNVPPDRFQDSAYFGWVTRTDALTLQEQEEDPEEGLFNCRALAAVARARQGHSRYRRDTDAREKRAGTGDPYQSNENTETDVIYMFMRLVPSRCNLGDSDRPQWWFFAVGGDKVLIKGAPVRTRHGGIPVVCTAPNARAHQIAPTADLAITLGQQIAVDFLVKQRLDFQDLVRNGKFILDPQMLEWRDFKNGGGPTVVRMKKRATGRDINTFYHQIDTTDNTAQNWLDAQQMIQAAKEGNGITEPASAMPDRPTAVGIDAIEGRSLGRMARIALIIDEQSYQEQSYQDLCNVTQWMGTEVLLGILGREDELIRNAYGLPPQATGLLVGGWDLDPDLDVVPLSAMATGPKNVPAMTEFAKTLAGVPGVMERIVANLRVEEFLTSYLRELGIGDIDWLKVNVNTMGNEQILAQQAAGNLVPMSQIAPGGAPA